MYKGIIDRLRRALIVTASVSLALCSQACGTDSGSKAEKASDTEIVSTTGSNGQTTANSQTTAAKITTLDFVSAKGDWYTVEVNNSYEMNQYNAEAWRHDGNNLYYTGATYTSRMGIDVSHHNGTIDWAKVKAAGIDFAIIRIGYRGYGDAGVLKTDTKAVENIKNARAAGLDVGVYFFSQAVSEAEAVEEAELTVKILSDAGLTSSDVNLPIVFDPEHILDDDARTDNVTGEQFTKNTISYLETIKAAGYEPMIYANMLWEAYELDLSQFKSYKIWYADYEETPQTPYRFEFWQYSESGTVDGVDGIVDLDVQMLRR